MRDKAEGERMKDESRGIAAVVRNVDREPQNLRPGNLNDLSER